jgi:hypothetical protein
METRSRKLQPVPQPAAEGFLSDGCLLSALAGVLAFLGSLAVGLVMTVIVVRSIPPTVPNPTEAYEGFGDYMMALFRFLFGALISFMVAVGVALVVAACVARRLDLRTSGQANVPLRKR